ncbi:hypothetical protein M0R45_032577 [Rubus argutus]|uniref:Wall-associated receptor kinase galacturonan-binding domain-containing protein n=1 Tax=Rubus argutus TaxID=59490 RepID=A0AAW1WLJ6_RUBAR
MLSIIVLYLWRLNSSPAVTAASGAALPIAKPNCQEKCGNVSIPYPFGIGPDCYFNGWFQIDCDQSTRHTPFLRLTQLEVLSISIKDGTLQRQTRFTAATCGFVSLVSSDTSVVGGCRSVCDKQNTSRYSDSCDIGTNCCQTSIPPYLTVVTASILVEGPANMDWPKC